MLFRKSRKQLDSDLRSIDPIELFLRCAVNCEDSNAWYEFLRRYSAKLKYFVRCTLLQATGCSSCQSNSITSTSLQEGDLFQNVIVRLVENDCAAMRRFSGASERELIAYMAVICRSTVMDTLRRSNALKRRTSAMNIAESIENSADSPWYKSREGFEREILAHELVSLFARTIESHSGQVSDRDQLVFELHFLDGLSYNQIAQCKGINLSRSGVEKLLKRLVDRVQNLASSGRSEETLQ
ncbi:MAG: sigma-70 family RNA polymerase sigma factor [Acidobacteria bacterium]|nr:sigma-70 family RNA polymerase sigma factor [Acidobacteriota bacterium]